MKEKTKVYRNVKIFVMLKGSLGCIVSFLSSVLILPTSKQKYFSPTLNIVDDLNFGCSIISMKILLLASPKGLVQIIAVRNAEDILKQEKYLIFFWNIGSRLYTHIPIFEFDLQFSMCA